MNKKWLFLFITILLLFPYFTYTGSNEATRDLNVRTEITKPAGLTIQSNNVSSVESVTSVNQTIVLKNPTFQELKDFILKDPLSRKQFVLNEYECRHFATNVVNAAVTEGLMVGFVLLCFDQGQHGVVAFNTTDRGLIYIEPQTDAAIEPKVGRKYEGKEIKEILIAW